MWRVLMEASSTCLFTDRADLKAEDRDGHLMCADGSLMHIPPGGCAQVKLDTLDQTSELCLWV
jgi:hypothetical protein